MRAAGIGFREGATLASLTDALGQAGAAPGLVGVAGDRAGHPAVRALAGQGWRVVPLPPEALPAVTLTESAIARARRGTGSLAEACALAAAGPGARLCGPRAISADRMASAALAEGGAA